MTKSWAILLAAFRRHRRTQPNSLTHRDQSDERRDRGQHAENSTAEANEVVNPYDSPYEPDLEGVLEQGQSPFFGKLPAEIRNGIYSYILTEDDSSVEVPFQSHVWQPDRTHAQKIDTTILRTCKRAYLEARHMTKENVTLRFWIGAHDRGPWNDMPFDPPIRLTGRA